MVKLKTISKFFIWGNVFDVLLTVFALNNGAIELNIIVNHFGWAVASIARFLLVTLIVYCLEKFKTWWFFWSLPVFMWMVVIWNVLNIVFILLDKILL